VFFNVMDSAELLPSFTLPKERLDGLAEILLTEFDVTPVPFKPRVPASPQLKKTVPGI
jgi:hypothetical protein